VKAGEEEFGHDGADLLWREVDDADDLAADEVFGGVEVGDLGTRVSDADAGTEVDGDFLGGLACLGEGFDVGDGAGA
jgi:hypothetical protein